MIKGFRQIAGLTTLSRVFGFIRDICYSHFFGAGVLLDAWIIAFTIPNLARRLFGEGATAAALIPVYSSQLRKDPQSAQRFVNTVLTVIFVLLAIIIIVGEGFIWGYWTLLNPPGETKTILSLTSIMLPYMLLVCLVAVLAGVLNVHRHFAAPAVAPVILNLFLIATILITGWIFGLHARQQVFFAAAAVIVAGFAQFAIQFLPLRKAGVTIRPEWKTRSQPFRKMLLLMGPMIIGLTVTQINTLADHLIAWWLSASPEKGSSFYIFAQQIQYPLQRGSVSHLYYAQRLYQLPLGVFGISLAIAIFPVMSAYAAEKDIRGLAHSISLALRAIIFIALPATAGLILIAGPLIFVAFQHGEFQPRDTILTTWTLFFYALGLSGYFAQQILTRAFYSLQESTPPMKSAIVAVFVNVLLNLTLIWLWGTGGLACSTALCSYLQVTILALYLKRRFQTSIFTNLLRTFSRTVLAAAVMILTTLLALQLTAAWPQTFRHNLGRLLITVPLAAATYIGAAKFFRIEMLGLLTGRRKITTPQNTQQ